jgi:hypothetical protein
VSYCSIIYVATQHRLILFAVNGHYKYGMIIFTPTRANGRQNPYFFSVIMELGRTAGLQFLPTITHPNRDWTQSEVNNALASANSVIEFKDWKHIDLFKNSTRKKIILLDQFQIHDDYTHLLNGVVYQLNPDDYYPKPRKSAPTIKIDKYPNSVDYSWADLIICVQEENLAGPEWVSYFNDPGAYFGTSSDKVISIVSGMNDDIRHNNKFPYNVLRVPTNLWFSWVSACNPPVEYDSNYDRPYKFEALLGGSKENRHFLFNKLEEHQLLDKGLVSISAQTFRTLIDKVYHDVYYRSPELDNYDDAHMLKLRSATRNGNWVGHTTHVPGGNTKKFYIDSDRVGNFTPYASFSIPVKVYQNSWFSVVAESIVHHSDFFTEKTAKALLGGRIFVAFGPQHSLRNLRESGYRTFGEWINENYDNEPNNEKRWGMAFEQVVQLINHKDPAAVYKEAQSVVEHNRQLISSQQRLLEPIDNFIQSFLNKSARPDPTWVPMTQNWTDAQKIILTKRDADRKRSVQTNTNAPFDQTLSNPQPVTRLFNDYDILQALKQARAETAKRRQQSGR